MNRRAAGPALAAALLSMAAVFVFKTYADAVFLAEYGVAYVPHFYVAQAAALIASSGAYTRLIRRGATRVDVPVLVATAALGAGAPFFEHLGGAWVFAVALGVLTLSGLAQLAVWNAATAIAGGRSARAFLPKVGAAATTGAALGAFGSTAIVGAADLDFLAPVGAALALVILALRLTLARRARPRQRSTRRLRAGAGARPAPRKLVLLLAAAAVTEALLTQFLDYGFKRAVTASFSDEDRIGLFFSLFYGGVNVAILGLQLFAASRLLSTRSLRRSLSLEPVVLGAMAALWIGVPALALAAVARGLEMVLKFAVARPAQEVALTPLAEHARRRWKVLLRGVFNQGGAAGAGVLLVVLAPLFTAHVAVVPAVATGLAVAWLVLQRSAASAYLDTLGAALGARDLSVRDGGEATLFDRDGVERVVRLAGHGDERVAAFGRELLRRVADEQPRALAPHIGGGDPAVRRAVYDAVAACPSRAFGSALRRAAGLETEEEAFAAALAALAAHDDAGMVERARVLARTGAPGDDEPAVHGAWLYLARVGALDGTPELRATATAALHRDGLVAARILAGAARRDALSEDAVDELVLAAIDGAPAEARAQALRAAAGLGRSRPLTRLLEAVESGERWAGDAIAQLDSAALRRLLLIAGARDLGVRSRQRLLRALRWSDLPEAAEHAARALSDPEPSIRSVAVRSLLKLQRDAGYEVDIDRIEEALAAQMARLERYVLARSALSADLRDISTQMRRRQRLYGMGREALFADELERATERALSRLCELLALLGNPGSVFAAERALASPAYQARRQAVDVLQEVARADQKARLLTLLEAYLAPPADAPEGALDRVCEIDPWLSRVRGDGEAELMRRVSALRGSVLFDRVAGDVLADLAEHADSVSQPAGAVVVREGDPGDALYVVLAGAFRVEVGDSEVARLEPGDAFGELSLVDGRTRGASVSSEAGGELLRLPRDVFQRALDRESSLGLGLVRGLVQWLRNAA